VISHKTSAVAAGLEGVQPKRVGLGGFARIICGARCSDGDLIQRSGGYLELYREHVLQADQGCDFDFLQAGTDIPEPEIH